MYTGVIRKCVEVVTYPVQEGDVPAGDYILKSIPEGIPQPCPFVKDSHLILQSVMEGIRTHFGAYAPHVVTEWEQWLCDCPKTDDVYEYVKEFPLHIPLRNKLFCDGAMMSVEPQSNNVVNDVNNAIYRAQPCVRMARKRPASKVALQRCDNVQDNAEVETRDKSKSKLVYMFLSFLTCIIRFK
jgi:hypothetical protein